MRNKRQPSAQIGDDVVSRFASFWPDGDQKTAPLASKKQMIRDHISGTRKVKLLDEKLPGKMFMLD